LSARRAPYLLIATATLLLAALALGGRGRADMVDMTGVEPWDVCGECHGLDGAGNRIKFPRLAGQKQPYIIKQLFDFRAGRRKNDGGQMQKTATELEEANIPRVAEWFASQTPPWPKLTMEAAPDLARARQLAMHGDRDAKIPACLSCHSATSPRLLVRSVDAPRIAGQRDFYIAKELNDFREGRRGNDPDQMMTRIARRLAGDDIASLAIFLSQNPDMHEAVVP
jgi:cytochrome c553